MTSGQVNACDHTSAVTYPALNLGICGKCRQHFRLREHSAKQKEEERKECGVAEGDYIRTTDGEVLRVFWVRDHGVLCKRMDEHGNDHRGDGSEVVVPFGQFTVTKTFYEWWNETHPDRRVELNG